MIQKISNLQLSLLVANFVFSSAVISLPQVIVQISGQNGWLVPIIIFPVLILLIYMVFGRKKNIEKLHHLFSIEKKGSVLDKVFIVFFFITVLLVFVRDLRGVVDFVASVLLPTTPIDMITILSVLVILYIAMAGLEVVTRINSLNFGLLMITILILPLLLLNEIDINNLQPVPSLRTAAAVSKSLFLSFASMGEIFLFLIVISCVKPIESARKSVLFGTSLSVLLFFIILFLEISVLGVKVVREATYPSFIMIQQINLTDFLDRLDPIIVVLWLPTIFTKIAFLLYAMDHCVRFLFKADTTKYIFPGALSLGYLSILLFKNNMDYLHFSFFTWASLGMGLELIVIALFVLVRRFPKDKKQDI